MIALMVTAVIGSECLNHTKAPFVKCGCGHIFWSEFASTKLKPGKCILLSLPSDFMC
jgi:hypothetical protein